MLENRRFQRVKLPHPIEGKIGTVDVSLIDVSYAGMQVHHEESLPPRDQRCVIRFDWNGSSIQLTCETIWTTIHRIPREASERPVMSTGLRVDSRHPSFAKMVAYLIEGVPSEASRENGRFLLCELVSGTWKQSRTSRRVQPEEGFTVSINEDPSQIARLCSAYASGDSETRTIIRRLAALSINRQESEKA